MRLNRTIITAMSARTADIFNPADAPKKTKAGKFVVGSRLRKKRTVKKMSVIQIKFIDFTCGCLCKDFDAMECTSGGAAHKGCKHYIPQEDYYVEHDGHKVFVKGGSSCSVCISTTKYKSVETNVYDMEDLSDYEDWYGFMLVTIKKAKYYCREVKIDGKLIFKNGTHYYDDNKDGDAE